MCLPEIIRVGLHMKTVEVVKGPFASLFFGLCSQGHPYPVAGCLPDLGPGQTFSFPWQTVSLIGAG